MESAVLRRYRHVDRPRWEVVLSRHADRPPAIVRLFSTILRKDRDGYVLVTPVEWVGIKVEDAPFLAVEMTVARQGADQVLRFRTNVEDLVEGFPEKEIIFPGWSCSCRRLFSCPHGIVRDTPRQNVC
jgi:Protein of unknown function (DUF1285)